MPLTGGTSSPPDPMVAPVETPALASSSPYIAALSAAIGSALFAAVITGVLDVVYTLHGPAAAGAKSGDTHRFFTIALSLYGAFALCVGVFEGIVAGAIRATYPGGAMLGMWRRFAGDEQLDRRVAGGILAGTASAGFYALAIAVLAHPLVVVPERKKVGALLLGGVAAAMLPVFALITYPFYRATRVLVRAVPRLGPVPATIVLVVFAGGMGATICVLYVVTHLDWRALPLGAPIAFGAFGLAQLVWVLLWYTPVLTRIRRLVPARSVILFTGIAIALLAPLVTLAGKEPSEHTVKLLLASRGASPLVKVARKAVDRDGDGYSPILGGGDCDDSNSRVHPGDDVVDEPGNGIDENCNGADALPPEAAVEPQPGKTPGDATNPAAPKFAWTGNIVIIAVDTLRADRLGVTGYQRSGKSITPNMDALAKRGVWFTHAYSQAPRTPTSFPSIFTSRYPSRIKFVKAFDNYPKITEDNVTIFEALHDAGWHTVGESSHHYFSKDHGIQQGFDEYHNDDAEDIEGSNHDTASPRITARVADKLKELAAAKQKFVLFTHLFEPHSTYVKHDECELKETSDAHHEQWIEKYDCEVQFADIYVGKIVDLVKEAGLDGNTMIVLVSDHGEEFFTHAYEGKALGWHGSSLYDAVLRVPLVIAAPGLAARQVDQPVMLIDLAPTLLDLIQAPIPKSFQGRSLVPLLVGEPLPPRQIHAELVPYPSFEHKMTALIDADGHSKTIFYESDSGWEVFDLTADPEEKKNLGDDDPGLTKKLKQEMAAWIDSGRQ